MMLHLRSQLYNFRFLTRHLPRQHPYLSLDPIESQRQCTIDRSHNRIASGDSCNTGAAGVIVLQGACTATTADAADLSVCSRGSSVQCFFDSVELAVLTSGSRGRLAATDLVQSLDRRACFWAEIT